MARIAGINIPPHKHAEIGLTSIYGIGRTTAQQICSNSGVPWDKKIRDLSDTDLERIREEIGSEANFVNAVLAAAWTFDVAGDGLLRLSAGVLGRRQAGGAMQRVAHLGEPLRHRTVVCGHRVTPQMTDFSLEPGCRRPGARPCSL